VVARKAHVLKAQVLKMLYASRPRGLLAWWHSVLVWALCFGGPSVSAALSFVIFFLFFSLTFHLRSKARGG